ncbi:unnamed protein product [Protopolystoma xenopodis]|uniref:Myb-like domain-containing protein n=1 Tax=Protopolystoma xenopodis TaxID=117903 RepID=A0A3S5A3B6_9PLAT|nr:unnamed protein product [Protopolystoma xenopodis]
MSSFLFFYQFQSPLWTPLELQLVVQAVSDLGSDYAAIAIRLGTKTPGMVAGLFETQGHRLRLKEATFLANASKASAATTDTGTVEAVSNNASVSSTSSKDGVASKNHSFLALSSIS